MSAETKVRWFDRQGNAVKQVLNAKGDKQINVTIKQARKLGLLPGVTSVIDLMASWTLQDWIAENLIRTCMLVPFRAVKQGEGVPEDEAKEYINMIHAKSKEYSEARADRGTELHAMVNAFFDDHKVPEDPVAKCIVDKIVESCNQMGITNVKGGRRFVNLELGYAGEPDLTGDYSDSVAIMDLKTTKLENFSSPYEKWKLQLGGYMGFKTDTGKNPILIQVVSDQDTGRTLWIPHEEDPIASFNAFKSLFEVFVWAKGYDPPKGGVVMKNEYAKKMGMVVTVCQALERHVDSILDSLRNPTGEARVRYAAYEILGEHRRAGWIVGIRILQEGIIFPRGYDEDGGLRIERTVPVYLVSYWPNMKPVLVPMGTKDTPDGYIVGGKPTSPSAWSWATTTTSIRESCKSSLRDEMVNWPRDTNGKWLKKRIPAT